MIYLLLRALLRHALAVFFRSIEVEGRDEVPPDGPLVLAANHPNTLIDVLLVATRLERRVGFVAKAPLFEHPLAGALLRYFGAVPVARRQEGALDEEAQARNARALAASEEAVAHGGAVLIFPEGVSQGEPRLAELRTGMARIALGAEARAPGQVVVVPVALTYDDAETFRSRARIRFAPPLRAAPFLELAPAPDPPPEAAPAQAGAGPPPQAVRALTAAVRDTLASEMVHVEDPQLAAVVRDLDRLYADAISAPAGGRLAATTAIARAVNHFAARDPARVAEVRARLDAYCAALAAAGVDDAAVRERVARPGLRHTLALVVGAPLALWGIVNHFVLYQIPRLVLSLIPVDPLYNASVKLTSGLLALVLCYGVQGALVAWAVAEHVPRGPEPWKTAALYLSSLPLAGVTALVWLEALTAWLHAARARWRRRRLPPETLRALRQRRRALMVALDVARAAYLAQSEAGEPD